MTETAAAAAAGRQRMEMSMGLAEFIKERLNEVEQTARAATPGPWRWRSDDDGCLLDLVAGDVITDSDFSEGAEHYVLSAADRDGDNQLSVGGDDAAHIARYDPARVLREVQDKRALIAAVEGDPFEAGAARAYESLVLEHLALVYVDHPDYDLAWRPDWFVLGRPGA